MSYIDRGSLLQELTDACDGLDTRFLKSRTVKETIDAVKNHINAIPAADVASVRHGRWDGVKNPQWPAYSHDKCSVCGWLNTKNALCYDGGHKPGHSLNYCPNCGAKMDGGAE